MVDHLVLKSKAIAHQLNFLTVHVELAGVSSQNVANFRLSAIDVVARNFFHANTNGTFCKLKFF